MSRWKLVAPLLVVLSLLSAPGCMGRMALTGKVTEFNLWVTEDKWGREATFLGLHITTVYSFSAFLDLLVFNSIEFWNGENPISGDSALTDS